MKLSFIEHNRMGEILPPPAVWEDESNDYVFNHAAATEPNFLKVFPNPGDGLFVVESTETLGNLLNVAVFDVQGRKVNCDFRLLNNKAVQLELNDLPNGLYLIELSNNNKVMGRAKVSLQK